MNLDGQRRVDYDDVGRQRKSIADFILEMFGRRPEPQIPTVSEEWNLAHPYRTIPQPMDTGEVFPREQYANDPLIQGILRDRRREREGVRTPRQVVPLDLMEDGLRGRR